MYLPLRREQRTGEEQCETSQGEDCGCYQLYNSFFHKRFLLIGLPM